MHNFITLYCPSEKKHEFSGAPLEYLRKFRYGRSDLLEFGEKHGQKTSHSEFHTPEI
jgi:hypothetical protein